MRGEELLELLGANDLDNVNVGSSPTHFLHGRDIGQVIDLTFGSAFIKSMVKGW